MTNNYFDTYFWFNEKKKDQATLGKQKLPFILLLLIWWIFFFFLLGQKLKFDQPTIVKFSHEYCVRKFSNYWVKASVFKIVELTADLGGTASIFNICDEMGRMLSWSSITIQLWQELKDRINLQTNIQKITIIKYTFKYVCKIIHSFQYIITIKNYCFIDTFTEI